MADILRDQFLDDVTDADSTQRSSLTLRSLSKAGNGTSLMLHDPLNPTHTSSTSDSTVKASMMWSKVSKYMMTWDDLVCARGVCDVYDVV